MNWRENGSLIDLLHKQSSQTCTGIHNETSLNELSRLGLCLKFGSRLYFFVFFIIHMFHNTDFISSLLISHFSANWIIWHQALKCVSVLLVCVSCAYVCAYAHCITPLFEKCSKRKRKQSTCPRVLSVVPLKPTVGLNKEKGGRERWSSRETKKIEGCVNAQRDASEHP